MVLLHKIGEKQMFVKCPKCQELIKDDAKTCPYCKYEITADDLRKAIREEEEEKREYENEKMEEVRHRRLVRIIVGMCFVIALPIIVLIGSKLDSKIAAYLLIGAWGVGLLSFELCTKYSKCPYCNTYLRYYGEVCQHCGGRLR